MLPKRVSPDPEPWRPIDVLVAVTCIAMWAYLIYLYAGCPALGCR